MQQYDLFGNVVEEKELLRDKFIEPPFSILDAKSGNWQKRKNKWKSLGIRSEVGRDGDLTYSGAAKSIDFYRKKEGIRNSSQEIGTSIFDPALCEILYTWFCPEKGHILDPFCGGSVRGIVAQYLGYYYTGIDIRQEQIDSNREQSLDILEVNNQPNYYVGDSRNELKGFNKQFDFVFSCPPYADLEVYSDLDGDISNMNYDNFMIAYRDIIKQSCDLLKSDCYACFVVGEVRDKKGNYIGFVPDTIQAFRDCGMNYYNEMILTTPIASASMRADKQFTASKKIVKVHQNVLVFKK